MEFFGWLKINFSHTLHVLYGVFVVVLWFSVVVRDVCCRFLCLIGVDNSCCEQNVGQNLVLTWKTILHFGILESIFKIHS
jgi:hypothetical protein